MITTETRTRAQHLAWAKERALACCDSGDCVNAMASMVSDLRKHPELADHAGIMLGGRMALAGHLSNVAQMRHWIEGFN